MQVLASLLLLLPLTANAVTFPEKPKADTWVLDKANLLDEASVRRINEVAFKLWKDERIPLYVVTMPAMEYYTGGKMPIESYAFELYNNWGIGSQARNYGMLLLVAVLERKARIELGAGYGRHHDRDAEQIMQEQIVARFKEDLYAAGIVAGVEGMDRMGRGLKLPSAYMSKQQVLLWIVGIVLCIGIGISLIMNGRSGWGWAFLVFAAAMLWFLLKAKASTKARSGSSSGGFGGGSSGGGGATGSW